MKNKSTVKASSADRRGVVITASIVGMLVLGIVVAIIAFVINAGSQPLDYLNDDLSKYVYVSEEDYKNFPVTSKLPVVDDGDVERKIMSLLYNNRAEEPILNGAYIKSEPLSIGDVAYVYYRGYTVDENGIETDIEKSSNLVEATLAEIEIGKLGYVKGFEEGLIGIIPKNCVKFEQVTEGVVEDGDVVYLSYTALYPNGTNRTVTSERVELSANWTDEKYGSGFTSYFIGKKIGERIKDNKTFDNIVYYDMKVDFVTRCESECVTIDVHFPEDYSEVSLRGVDAKFDIYVEYAKIYDAPEYNDAFVTDVLKVGKEELASYEGSSVSERYKAKIKADLIVENEEKRATIIAEDMWAHLRKKAVLKDLPEADVEAIYNEYYDEVSSNYANYQSYYSSIDEFATSYFSLSTGADWKGYIRAQAEDVIFEKLIFYYIAVREGFVPTDSDFDRMYDEVIDEYVDHHAEVDYKDDLDKCKTEEERAKKLEQIEREIIAYYGKTYFVEMVYYDYAVERMIKFAVIS